MADEELWSDEKLDAFNKPPESNLLRISLLFAVAIGGLAVVLTPELAQRTPGTLAYEKNLAYDNIMTGSVPKSHSRQNIMSVTEVPVTSFTLRRSITQEGDEACIIYDDSLRVGNC